MSNQQQISTPPDSKYFHRMLNMADDDLGPYEYRLLGHYIRVGDCWEGVRKTAKTTRMSVGKVVSTRNDLEKLGYIHVEHREQDTCLVTIIDRMAENVARYSKVFMERTPRSPHEHPVHMVNTSELEGVHGVNERRTRTKEEEPKKKKEIASTDAAQLAPSSSHQSSSVAGQDSARAEHAPKRTAKTLRSSKPESGDASMTDTPTIPLPPSAPAPKLTPAALLGEAFGIPPVGKRAFGKYGEVAKVLIDATVTCEDFKRYIDWTRRESKQTGDWTVTITALMNADRLSKYVAARNAHDAQGRAQSGVQVLSMLDGRKNAYKRDLDPAYAAKELSK